MITIESDVLVTIAVAAVSIAISSVVTWHFSKRRYSRAPKPVTEKDLELEKTKNEFRSDMLGFLLVLAMFLGGIGLVIIIVLNTP